MMRISLHKPLLNGILISLLSLATSCEEDRTTVVYGRIVDQDQRPIDSIMVTLSGVRMLHSEVLQSTYTDQNGAYEMALTVPKRYHAINAGIPYFPVENPKYQKNYQISRVFQNTKEVGTCCHAPIGEKTEWDFELMPQ